MKRQRLILICSLLLLGSLLLAACSNAPTPAPAATEAPATAIRPAATATALPPTAPPPTTQPTAAAENLIPYRHASGVFELNIPGTWNIADKQDGESVNVTFTSDRLSDAGVVVLVRPLGSTQSTTFKEAAQTLINQFATSDLQTRELNRLDAPHLVDHTYAVKVSGQDGTLRVVVRDATPYIAVLIAAAPNTQWTEISKTVQAMVSSFKVDGSVDLFAASGQGLTLVSTSHATTNEGTVNVFGEVRNERSDPVAQVQARVELLDAAGQALAAKRGLVSLSYLKPGETAPFQALFTDNVPEFASVQITLGAAGDASFELGYNYRDLVVENDKQDTTSLGFTQVTGEIRNTGSKPARSVSAIATFYDAAGTIVGSASGFIQGDKNDKGEVILEPGKSAPFELSAITTTGEVASYHLVADGVLAQ